jgi:hypothetical protein
VELLITAKSDISLGSQDKNNISKADFRKREDSRTEIFIRPQDVGRTPLVETITAP